MLRRVLQIKYPTISRGVQTERLDSHTRLRGCFCFHRKAVSLFTPNLDQEHRTGTDDERGRDNAHTEFDQGRGTLADGADRRELVIKDRTPLTPGMPLHASPCRTRGDSHTVSTSISRTVTLGYFASSSFAAASTSATLSA